MLMKNIYKMLYTINNFENQQDDLIDIDEILEFNSNCRDIENLLDLIHLEPDKKTIDKILSYAKFSE
jgi:hypothetical protein